MSAKVYSRLNDEQRKVVRDILNGSDNLARSVYLRYERELVLLDGRWTKVANFNPNDVGVRLNLAEVFARRNDGDRPSGTTWFHEFGHMIDHLSSGPGSWAEKLRAGISAEDVNLSTSYRGEIFAKTIRKEVNAYIDKRNVDMRRGFKSAVADGDLDWLKNNGYIAEWQVDYLREHPERTSLALSTLKHTKADAYCSVASEISAMTDAQKADLSDLFGGATLNKCSDGWGHTTTYWKPKGEPRDYELMQIANEGFAEFFSAYTANPESLAILRKYLPESSKIFEDMLKGRCDDRFNPHMERCRRARRQV